MYSNDGFLKWFWKKYHKIVIVGTIIFCLLLIIIYLVFAFTSFIPEENNLKRSDWLVFVGGILGLIGSIIVSIISITQASYFNEKEQARQEEQRKYVEKQRREDRLLEIKPELVIVINERNVRIPYIDFWPSEDLHMAMFGTELPKQYRVKEEDGSPYNMILNELNRVQVINDYPIDNVWISLVNIGKYAVNHIEVYGEYYFPFIRPGDSIDLILTLDKYPRNLDAFKSSESIDRINDSNSAIRIIDVRKEKIDIEGAHVDKPKQYDYIWIDYEDVDGNGYQQKFRIHPSGVGNYYCNDEQILQ